MAGLAEISQTHFVQIELGLQTSNEKTGQLINRCYTNQDYINAVRRICEMAPDIHIVTHLIFGLPGESEEDMLNSVRFVVGQNRHFEKKESHPELRERRLKADKMLQWSILSESPSNYVAKGQGSFWGIKITSLYVLQNTRLAAMYEAGEYQPLSKEQYFDLLKKALPLLPEACVVHRLTGDPPKSILLAPEWPKDKKGVLNELKNIGLQFKN